MSAKKVSLWETFVEVPDPRSPLGRRYPLQAILTLSSVAMLSGARSLYAIAQFGRDYGQELAKALGFPRGKTPCCTALHYLFQDLDASRFEQALRGWLKARREEGWQAVALDGKTLRGTQGHQIPGVHLLAAYAPEAAAVLGQLPVKGHTNEHKAALRLLHVLPLKDTIVTGDAMFCHKDLSRKVLKKGGQYVWAVKDNQSQLKEQIVTALSETSFSPSGSPSGRRRTPASPSLGQGTRTNRTPANHQHDGLEGLQRLAGSGAGI